MYRIQFYFWFFILSGQIHGQVLSQSEADALLPAFRNDDSTTFQKVIEIYNVDVSGLVDLASVTNNPKIFRYLLNNYPDIDTETSVSLAISFGKKPILEVALNNSISLGEYPINDLLAYSWFKEEDDESSNLLLELLLYSLIPESSIDEYLPLLENKSAEKDLIESAIWLIEQDQGFDYSDLSKLANLSPDFKPIFNLLVKRLYELPEDLEVPGFENKYQALIYAAVLDSDLSFLKELDEYTESFEFTVPENQNLFSFAVLKSSMPVIKFLLSRDVNPNYHHLESRNSVLGALLIRRDESILEMVMPYITSTSMILEDAHTPVSHCVKSFFELELLESNKIIRQFYFSALKSLRFSGADFNQENLHHQLPIHGLSENLKDSLSRSVALLVISQTSDELSLEMYAGVFKYLTSEDYSVLSLLCQQMKDPSQLFYNSNLKKSGLFPLILQEVNSLPPLDVFSILLRSACYYKNVQEVRWLLNDVPMAYLKRYPLIDQDSLRNILVNTPDPWEGENILFSFLKQDHFVDWESKSVMKALMASGADLFQQTTQAAKRPIDLILESNNYQKGYANEILSGLLPNLQLQLDDPGAWNQTSTGDLYRKSIIAYQEDKNWVRQLKNCITMDLSGSGISPLPNRRVNIAGVGLVELGNFPVKTCDPLDLYKIAGSPPRYVFNFRSSIGIHNSSLITTREGYNDFESLVASINLDGKSNLEKTTMNVSSVINIPGFIMNYANHSIPPAIVIRNNGDQVIIKQQNKSSYLSKGMEQIFDRSKGPLEVLYNRNNEDCQLRLDIFCRFQDTEFPDLMVPVDTDLVSRIRLYAEIIRLQKRIIKNPNKTTEDQIYRRQDEVLIHLLSEYALQRYYPKQVKEEHDQNIRRMTDLNKLMEPLGQFYLQYSVLDFNNLPQLKKTLQELIDGPLLTVQQKNDYTYLLQRLDNSTQLSELAESYGQLMNSELLQQAEKQLDDKKRIILESALYGSTGHLNLDN